MGCLTYLNLSGLIEYTDYFAHLVCSFYLNVCEYLVCLFDLNACEYLVCLFDLRNLKIILLSELDVELC
jgi:hypothetical protein